MVKWFQYHAMNLDALACWSYIDCSHHKVAMLVLKVGSFNSPTCSFMFHNVSLLVMWLALGSYYGRLVHETIG